MIELCIAVRAIAEEADADTLPVAATHGEGVADRGEASTVGTEMELVAVLAAVVGEAEIEA